VFKCHTGWRSLASGIFCQKCTIKPPVGINYGSETQLRIYNSRIHLFCCHCYCGSNRHAVDLSSGSACLYNAALHWSYSSDNAQARKGSHTERKRQIWAILVSNWRKGRLHTAIRNSNTLACCWGRYHGRHASVVHPHNHYSVVLPIDADLRG